MMLETAVAAAVVDVVDVVAVVVVVFVVIEASNAGGVGVRGGLLPPPDTRAQARAPYTPRTAKEIGAVADVEEVGNSRFSRLRMAFLILGLGNDRA
eukprot:CAMPEP_0183340746 /NCGR_PEP_ID=MMETSP0164_2-20130417/7189_1 /TAXON_ID=221442 /ORGANISM="Coccolithus pelagicus ssp braarudi, Strain PLY182g" /LENGTH=95 /DNA_ID=CAMNT_0025510927 /DNA_START=1437 /DNA_END=1724 /DNA_ORIENTATION=+